MANDLNSYKKEITKVLNMMCAVFRDTPDRNLIEAWTTIMISEKVTIAELQDAAIQVMKSRVYNKLPTPADILDIIRPRVNYKAIAEAQADEVLAAVRRCGPDRKPDFSDPITARLMSTRWGWSSFARDLESDRATWWRRDFVDAYQAAAATGEVKRIEGRASSAKQIGVPNLSLARIGSNK